MPTWCHMFNSTLTGNAKVWFDKLPRESIDSYEDLRTAFRENYLQQTKYIKDPVEIHHIKQRDGESTEDFMERYKAEILDVEGASECTKISGFMHDITHPELIKHLYEKIPRSMDEMYRVTTSFLQGEVAAFSQSRKRRLRHGNNQKEEASQTSKGAPPLMVTPAEKRDPNKYCEFHANMGHNMDECMQLRKQIDEMIKAAKERVTPSFSPETAISFPPLGDEDGMEGPMIIKAEIGGHFVHRIYVDGGASSEILYEHCFVNEVLVTKGALQIEVGNLGMLDHEVGRLCDEYAWWKLTRRRKIEVLLSSYGSEVLVIEVLDHMITDLKDFKGFNKRCPMDGYRYGEIDWKVESLWGTTLMFPRRNKGYTKSKWQGGDQEKIAFITSHTKDILLLKDVVRPKECQGNLSTFGRQGIPKAYRMQPGTLKVCPDKEDAVLSFPSPRCLKDVQKLNGKLANSGSRSSLQTDEETYSGTPNADCTKGKRGANHVAAKMVFPGHTQLLNHRSADKAAVFKLEIIKERYAKMEFELEGYDLMCRCVVVIFV
ncbi:reverse transcriptase domain-containing protein [Tanacetum coccineum]